LKFFLIAFYQNGKKAELVRRMNLKFLQTTSGGMLDSFNRWKTIPLQQEYGDVQKGSAFEVVE
jgi:hypothetical protein